MAKADSSHWNVRVIRRAHKALERRDPVEIVVDAGRRSREQNGFQRGGIGQRFSVSKSTVRSLRGIGLAKQPLEHLRKEPCRARFGGETPPVSMMVIFGMRDYRGRRHSGMRRLAQARNPYSLSWLWIPGSPFGRPE